MYSQCVGQAANAITIVEGQAEAENRGIRTYDTYTYSFLMLDNVTLGGSSSRENDYLKKYYYKMNTLSRFTKRTRGRSTSFLNHCARVIE